MISPLDQLLQLWRPIFQEGIQFCNEIEQVPESCACNDADMHLEGRCPCCQQELSQDAASPQRETCTATLTRLRIDLALFVQDFQRISATFAAAGAPGAALEVRRGVFLAVDDLQGIVQAVEHVGHAVIGFRRSCDLSELQSLKHRSAQLLQHLVELNSRLEPTAPS